jgi:isopenicillin N synthase-like dioxygenase
LQASMVSNMKRFFDLPLHEKKSIDINKSGILWKGYFEFGEEHTSSKPDLLEGILYRR